MNILILHGPNLNLLGEREPHIYGTTTLWEINATLRNEAEDNHLAIHQSNAEGKLISYIHEYRKWAEGLIINPGALTHYSYSLRDAITSFAKPTIEVHLSDISKREEFRRFSVLDGLSNVERIMGLGAKGYSEALKHLIS
jgi:3-dehydroquinate dehydratase-2